MWMMIDELTAERFGVQLPRARQKSLPKSNDLARSGQLEHRVGLLLKAGRRLLFGFLAL